MSSSVTIITVQPQVTQTSASTATPFVAKDSDSKHHERDSDKEKPPSGGGETTASPPLNVSSASAAARDVQTLLEFVGSAGHPLPGRLQGEDWVESEYRVAMVLSRLSARTPALRPPPPASPCPLDLPSPSDTRTSWDGYTRLVLEEQIPPSTTLQISPSDTTRGGAKVIDRIRACVRPSARLRTVHCIQDGELLIPDPRIPEGGQGVLAG
ncbi:hypothetical protein DFH09DRAFT_1365032 [Mycena vulgaris]|nr:hypothetical protein DFH09DRAFT_1365032 [Mycena vulgaris]